MRVRTAIKAANPRAVLSAAVAPEIETSAAAKLQDWRTWLDQGLVDVLCPMAYRLSSPATLQHIDLARRSGAAGVVLFSYDALVSPPHSAGSLARAAFAAGSQ